MTEQERVSKIEDILFGLEKQISALRVELNDLKETRQTAEDTATDLPVAANISDTPASAPISTPEPASKESPAPVQVPEPILISVPVSTFPAPEKPMPEKISASAPVAASVKAQETATAKAPETTTAKVPEKKKTTSGFEENLGGKVMGIVAAVLIFIGLFLFGSMLYERLGDTARIAILFIVSFLFLAAGLVLERKRESWFTTSLVGCGFGAIYISLFITALYFKRFEPEVLYLLLLFWLAGTGLYVFRRQSYAVALLGQIGITFSVIFGCLGIESEGQFTFLCVYFTAISLLYLWIVLWRFLPDTEKKPYSWIQLTAFCLNELQLWIVTLNYGNLFGGRNLTVGILLCLYSLVLPLFFLVRQRVLAGLSLLPGTSVKHDINNNTFPVYKAGAGFACLIALHHLITWLVFASVSNILFEADVPNGLFLLAGLLISYLMMQYFGPTGIEGRGITIINTMALLILLLGHDFPPLLKVLIPMLFCTVTLLFGMFGSEYPVRSVPNLATHRWEYVCNKEKGHCFDKFTACVYLLPIMCSHDEEAPFVLFLITVFGIAFFAGAFAFLYCKGRNHHRANHWKIALYLSGLFYFATNFAFLIEQVIDEDILCSALLLTVLVLCNCGAFYSKFRKQVSDTKLADPTANLFVYLVQNIFWIWGISLLHSGAMGNHPFLCTWMIVLTLYLCGNGLYEQYKNHGSKPVLGVYFGLRITLYTMAVITAFDGVEGYFISCILLVLAILYVLAGFPLRLAPLRIFGLCLAMFAVVKLLMIDVEHDNSMETVLCFLGAGILCFAINFIYNYVKKRFQ